MNRNKLIYSILKEIEKGNVPTPNDYGVTLNQFGEAVEIMLAENYIEKAVVERAGIEDNILYARLNHAKIRLPGLQYLEENSAWAKTYSIAKEVRDWIK